MTIDRCRAERQPRPRLPARWLAAAVALVFAAIGVAVAAQSASAPARIVSTSPSITETLFALGAGDRVIGVSAFCRFPAAATKLPKVGTFLKPNVEVIAQMKPDLVFVHTGPNAAASQLATLGIRTATIDRGSLANTFSNIREIGTAAGVAERAERLIGDLNARLDRVKAAVAGKPPRKVLMIVGRRTGTLTDLVAAGRNTYLNDLAALAGGVNVLGSSGTPEYPRISMETVISLSPDVIIDVGEMGQSPADADRRRQVTEGLWQRQAMVRAVKENGLHATNDEAWVVPGPRVAELAETMALWFHGVKLAPAAAAAGSGVSR